MGRWQARAGQGSIPLGPSRRRLVSEIPGHAGAAVLPAAVRRVGRPIERVGFMSDVANEHVVYGVLVDVEGRHLRDGHFL